MRLPRESESSWAHLTFAGFTWSSLLAWIEVPDLKEADRAELAKLAASLKSDADSLLKEARDTQDAALFARPAAQAKQNASLVVLKRRVNEVLSMVAIRLGGGSKEHPAVRAFLPGLLTGFARASVEDRPRLASEAAARLDSGEAFDERATLAAKLKDAAAQAQAALEANEAAQAGWSKERSEEVVAKGRLRLSLERTHRQLGAMFPGQRELVESFFLKSSGKPSEGTTEDEGPGAETTEG
ncbi:hypothetical protein [Polyangium aurulentum]|uniref:hypothetical protein n=1 Tax=Polyangium aurulentum TaxID=2567896 RepID=UPI0010AE134E|nr:hypothetical protein [Polyangium aurulentum]UQA62271.1 hypothetical protein E8A73_018080 [Polyangium aurulentum]